MRAPLLALAVLAVTAPNALAGSMVDVTVEVAGRAVPLLDAVDGSGRLYFEARAGAPYALRVTNRSHQRVGAVVVVDGLNVISGERETIGSGRPGRLYVLAPWSDVEIRGWRTSLESVRQFTFVDERSSYAARAGKANARMGWVEVAVHHDLAPPRVGGLRRDAPAQAPSAPSSSSEREQDAGAAKSAGGANRYPGTGWGDEARDPAVEVRFDASPRPAETVVLRYEYASALRAMGILPSRGFDRDRLRERDRGEGFAQPPRW